MLGGVHTVIVDEVHTLARDKRGSHLALTLERLDHVVAAAGGRLQRIGLSATQRPLEVVARLLSGVDPDPAPTTIVDCGHRRDLDVAIELPGAELEAVASGRPAGRRARPHRRPRARAPDHPGVRQHPQDGRAGGPPAGPAPRRPAGADDGRRRSTGAGTDRHRR